MDGVGWSSPSLAGQEREISDQIGERLSLGMGCCGMFIPPFPLNSPLTPLFPGKRGETGNSLTIYMKIYELIGLIKVE